MTLMEAKFFSPVKGEKVIKDENLNYSNYSTLTPTPLLLRVFS